MNPYNSFLVNNQTIKKSSSGFEKDTAVASVELAEKIIVQVQSLQRFLHAATTAIEVPLWQIADSIHLA